MSSNENVKLLLFDPPDGVNAPRKFENIRDSDQLLLLFKPFGLSLRAELPDSQEDVIINPPAAIARTRQIAIILFNFIIDPLLLLLASVQDSNACLLVRRYVLHFVPFFCIVRFFQIM